MKKTFFSAIMVVAVAMFTACDNGASSSVSAVDEDEIVPTSSEEVEPTSSAEEVIPTSSSEEVEPTSSSEEVEPTSSSEETEVSSSSEVEPTSSSEEVKVSSSSNTSSSSSGERLVDIKVSSSSKQIDPSWDELCDIGKRYLLETQPQNITQETYINAIRKGTDGQVKLYSDVMNYCLVREGFEPIY